MLIKMDFNSLIQNGDEAGIIYQLNINPDLANQPIDSDSSLYLAHRYGKPNIFKILLKYGADPNALYSNDNTLHRVPILHMVLYSIKSVQELINHGVNVNGSNLNGDICLHTPICRSDVVKLLIDNGVNVNAVGSYGATPLIIQASMGNVDMVKVLLENGADVNAKNDNGVTALHRAATTSYDKIVKLLLIHGADRSICDDNGHTATNLAINYKHYITAEIIRDYEEEFDVKEPEFD